MDVPPAVTANHPPLDIYSSGDFLQDFSVINIPHPPPKIIWNKTKSFKMKSQALPALRYAAQGLSEKSEKFMASKTVFPGCS